MKEKRYVMVKMKYYAVKLGRQPGIYQTWAQCQEQIRGVSGAIYKSFTSLSDAEQYIQEPLSEVSTKENISSSDINEHINQELLKLKDNEVVAFVDGSFQKNKLAFGVIIFDNKGNKEKLYKAFTETYSKEFIDLRNVAAELEGVKEAIQWSLKYGKKKILIYYDYEGIEKWADGSWLAKNNIAKNYVSFVREHRRNINISFFKVPAHSDVTYNEEVDTLAKNALLEKGYKTYNDGSIYIVGYGEKDWKSIIDSINEENRGLNESPAITYSVECIEERKKIKILQQKDQVTVNCYNDSKSYVQGKQSVLFQKVIARAIEFMDNKQEVVETLNSYHALDIKIEDVDLSFSALLPNYRHESEKLYSNLLSVIYNTKITGYMPDYTCLVTPIFRAYEYYLHKILGDVLEQSTTKNNGANNFSYFTKIDHMYKYSGNNKDRLSLDQLNYLNNFYNNYNKIRHPYSHWSANEEDVAIITDINEARNLLLDGLKHIDRYYILF